MSNYIDKAFNPVSGRIESASWLDDHFGPHAYGVRFENEGHVYRPDEVALEKANEMIAALKANLDREQRKLAHLKQEAEFYAGEARAANATIYRSYQAVTGATGEPGNWNGALPIIEALTSLRAEVADLKAKLAETEKQVYAPGQWRCAKCKFTLTQMAIYADTGVISTNDVPGEKCPNCDGPLWRVTERQCANELGERLEEMAGRAFEAERKLAEREGELTAEEMRERCANYLDEYADGFQEYADGHGFRSAAKTIRAFSTKREEG